MRYDGGARGGRRDGVVRGAVGPSCARREGASGARGGRVLVALAQTAGRRRWRGVDPSRARSVRCDGGARGERRDGVARGAFGPSFARCEGVRGASRAPVALVQTLALLGRARKDGAGSRHAAASLARACAAALVASLRVSRAMRLALGAGSATVGLSAVSWATSRLLGSWGRDRGRARHSDGARHGGSAPPRDALLATRGPSERRRRSRWPSRSTFEEKNDYLIL